MKNPSPSKLPRAWSPGNDPRTKAIDEWGDEWPDGKEERRTAVAAMMRRRQTPAQREAWEKVEEAYGNENRQALVEEMAWMGNGFDLKGFEPSRLLLELREESARLRNEWESMGGKP